MSPAERDRSPCAQPDQARDDHHNEAPYESWVGVPPMHHETWLTYGPRDSYLRGWTGRRMMHSAYYPGSDDNTSLSKHFENFEKESRSKKRIDRSSFCTADAGQAVTDRERLDLNEKKKRMMPAHLLPFIPYIEKSVDGPQTSQLRKREGSIRVETIRNWMETCTRVHRSRCGNIPNTERGTWNGPLWLIDVVNQCLVPAPQGAAYVALSYVWGKKATSSCTTRSNLSLFQQEKGLCEDKDTLPRVITDAIELVRSLGISFLWVDRFCIVQDDGVAKQCQLNAMGSVYANAHFTLVAAQNDDVTQGLYGIEDNKLDTTDRSLSKASADFTDTEILLDHAMHLMRSKWYSRGWTLQEYLLSKRRVVFHNDTVNWECLCAAWHESHDLSTVPEAHQVKVEQPGGYKREYTPQARFEFESLPWPNMFRYARLVSMYNRHDLTFPEDVLDAFAGILTHLSRSFPGGFISGLPQMCFDAALLWQPWTTLTRRKAIGRSASDATLPSWSWVGWAGNMNSESWRSAANYLFETDDEANKGQQCSWKTISTVKWTYSIDLTSRRKEVRISPEFSHTQPESQIGANLPAGWSAKVSTDAFGQTSYHHTCDPTHPFRYPIPIRDQHKAHIPPVSARYLYGNTTRGVFKLGSRYQSIASDCPARDLLTTTGEWAGVLRLDRTNCTNEILLEEIRGERSRNVELIEISEGEVRKQRIEEKSFDEYDRVGFARHGEFYEFVNVLWVEWEGGVAFRKALGRVERGVWRKVAEERIEVTLG